MAITRNQHKVGDETLKESQEMAGSVSKQKDGLARAEVIYEIYITA